MPGSSTWFTRTLVLLAGCLAFTSTCLAAPITATVSGVQAGSTYDYTITLSNPSALTFGTFWFAWVPGDNFLTTGAVNKNTVTQPADFNAPSFPGNDSSIRWETTSSSGVNDTTDVFTFQSTESPAGLLQSTTYQGITYPDLTFFLYRGNNATASPLVEGPITATLTPEPGSLILALTGVAGLAGGLRTRWQRRK